MKNIRKWCESELDVTDRRNSKQTENGEHVALISSVKAELK